jgi:hypothetical protein
LLRGAPLLPKVSLILRPGLTFPAPMTAGRLSLE